MSNLYNYDVDIDHIINNPDEDYLPTFLNSLKLHIPSFVSFYQKSVWFSLANKKDEFQAFVNNYDGKKAKSELRVVYPEEPRMIIMQEDPKVTTNPVQNKLIWINEVTGKMFTCVSNEIDKNVWIGSSKGELIRPVPSSDIFDILGDDSTVAFYQLNSNTLDMGGKYKGTSKNITWKEGLEGECAFSGRNGQIKIDSLPFDSDTESVTIGAWVKWNGVNGSMPFGFKKYNLYTYRGFLGFNTGSVDVYGFDFKSYKNKWVYLMAVFKKGDYGKIYINGTKESLAQINNQINTSAAKISRCLHLFGWGASSGYRNFGLIERVRIINREITDAEASLISSSEIDFITSINGGI